MWGAELSWVGSHHPRRHKTQGLYSLSFPTTLPVKSHVSYRSINIRKDMPGAGKRTKTRPSVWVHYTKCGEGSLRMASEEMTSRVLPLLLLAPPCWLLAVSYHAEAYTSSIKPWPSKSGAEQEPRQWPQTVPRLPSLPHMCNHSANLSDCPSYKFEFSTPWGRPH